MNMTNKYALALVLKNKKKNKKRSYVYIHTQILLVLHRKWRWWIGEHWRCRIHIVVGAVLLRQLEAIATWWWIRFATIAIRLARCVGTTTTSSHQWWWPIET